MQRLILFIILFTLSMEACSQNRYRRDKIICGAEITTEYLSLLKGKRTGVVANQTSIVGRTHLVDTLLSSGVDLVKIFSPEHGFRGDIEDGALIGNERDRLTGLPVISLYGKNKEIPPQLLEDIDIMIFDLQDVGVRFYTFISTMHYVMKSCAVAGKKLIVLDRPDPNGNYIDGPVLDTAFRSFVGMHPIPVVHGLTIGELAGMINGEGWLGSGLKCDLTVIPCRNYDHSKEYIPPVATSPNLPNYQSLRLYSSLAFFEGTKISVGRGTDFPFQVFGHPDLTIGKFWFTPVSKPGFSLHPPCEGQKCRGLDLRNYTPVNKKWESINLEWLIEAYKNFKTKDEFFTSYFDKLAGTDKLRKSVQQGKSSAEIRTSWKKDLEDYLRLRNKYLLYPE